jgi:hypothetical protein
VLADTRIHAAAEFDVSNGRRGKARSVRGAKKHANQRFRVRENAATRRSAGATEQARMAARPVCVLDCAVTGAFGSSLAVFSPL